MMKNMTHLQLMGVEVALLDPAGLLFQGWQMMLSPLPGLVSSLESWGLAAQQSPLLALPQLRMQGLVFCMHQRRFPFNLHRHAYNVLLSHPQQLFCGNAL